MAKISQINARLFKVPLAEILSDAKHGDHTHFELVTATITLADGSSGTGYTYTGGKGGSAIKAIGKASREDLEEMLGQKVHLFLFVKVDPKWMERREAYQSVGLEFDA